MYYMSTTLSTIGYGDLLPISTAEKWINCLIQVICTTLFAITVSNIMFSGNQFNFLGGDNEKNLRQWFVTISRIRN
jgi:hypothetical protein